MCVPTCSYLTPEKSTDSIDGIGGDQKTVNFNPVFQFPREAPQFPTHPTLPFKPKQIELRQPQMKFTPGAGNGRMVVPQTDSPFPAPYLHGRGPGMQTPFSELPIQRQPRAYHVDRQGSIQVATATMQRKKRASRGGGGKGVRQDSLTKPTTTVTDVDVGSTNDVPEHESESKVTFEKDDEEKIKKRQARGRQMSLPAPPMTARGRKRVFSTTGKRTPPVGGYEGVEGETSQRLDKRRKPMHRARTVGSSPSQQPAINPEKYRRCLTPEFSVDGDRMLKPGNGRRGLALRKCKTPDTIVSRSEPKKRGAAKRVSESPETEGSSNLTSSPGSKSGGQPEEEQDIEEEEGEEGEGEGGQASAPSTHGDSPLTNTLSADSGHRRKWGSWREKSRKDPGSPQDTSRKSKIPAHISSSTSAYLLSGSVAADEGGKGEVSKLKNPPYVYFSLYFDIQRRALTVNLVKVENLPPKPPNQGSCDPFVMMFLLPNKQEVLQSVIKQRTLNPEFQQVFEFGGILANDLKNQVLVFRVFDHDRCVCVCVCACACVRVRVRVRVHVCVWRERLREKWRVCE